jgi:hypothetical protein
VICCLHIIRLLSSRSMSGATLDINTIPPTATMDADKEDGSHREGPVANTNINASPSITAASDNSISTNILDTDVPNSTSITTPLPQPTTPTISTAAVPTETTHHQTSTPQRLPYKYDPDKITLRFLFANRDGLTVTVSCNPSDTIGEVKGVLISIWPKGKCKALDRYVVFVWHQLFLTTTRPTRCNGNSINFVQMYRIVRMGMIYD